MRIRSLQILLIQALLASAVSKKGLFLVAAPSASPDTVVPAIFTVRPTVTLARGVIQKGIESRVSRLDSGIFALNSFLPIFLRYRRHWLQFWTARLHWTVSSWKQLALLQQKER